MNFFIQKFHKHLFGYLEDKFRIPKSEFTLERAANELSSKGISIELVNKMRTNAEKCEYIRFAPETNPKQAMNEMYKAFSEVVIDIERSILK